jgi:hypothetical protein
MGCAQDDDTVHHHAVAAELDSVADHATRDAAQRALSEHGLRTELELVRARSLSHRREGAPRLPGRLG